MRLVVVAVAVAAMTACSGSEEEILTVFAASSLSAAFEDLAAGFERHHPETRVVLNLAGSQTLATQIANGAQPDVFASADGEQMERAVAVAEPEEGPVEFATNRLAIVVAAGNPKRIRGLEDLSRDDVAVVLGADEVPVGRYAARTLAAAGVAVEGASRELDTGLVLAKVALGEADAGIVYHSDLRRADESVEGVAIPPRYNVEAVYPMVAWQRDGTAPGLASSFVAFVTSEEGAAVLRRAGLGA